MLLSNVCAYRLSLLARLDAADRQTDKVLPIEDQKVDRKKVFAQFSFLLPQWESFRAAEQCRRTQQWLAWLHRSGSVTETEEILRGGTWR